MNPISHRQIRAVVLTRIIWLTILLLVSAPQFVAHAMAAGAADQTPFLQARRNLHQAPAAQPGNLARPDTASGVLNPSFELGDTLPNSWEAWGAPATLDWDATVAHTGTHSVSISGLSQPQVTSAWRMVTSLPVDPAAAYEFSAWYRWNDAPADLDIASIVLEQYDGSGSPLGELSWPLAATAGDWQFAQHSLVGQFAQTTASVRIRLERTFEASTSPSTIWFDDISLTAGFCDGVSEIPASECQALEALYNSTDGPNWLNSDGWLVSNTPCSWHGVLACSEYHISLLALDSNQLMGSIPPEIGALRGLIGLSLSDNELEGVIPTQIETLTGLLSLDLSINFLEGDIPSQIGNLSHLQHLILDDNSLSGAIPAQVSTLGNLQELSLSANRFSGSIPDLSNLLQLNRLALDDNRLDGEIPASLGSLPSLRTLNLAHNYLAGSVPLELCGLALLETLNLSDNELSGAIPFQLGSLPSLKELDLSSNDLAGQIPAQLGDLATLNHLILGSTKLTGEIPSQLGSLLALKTLDLSGNSLTGALPSQLGDLPALEILLLNSNQLTGGIPPNIGNATGLQGLNLSSNNLVGGMPPELGNLVSLVELDLSYNGLSGSIPPSLGALVDLQVLRLFHNTLSGSIPSELGALTQLRNLYLDTNGLTGIIPPELGALSSLELLYLYDNALTGSIPSTLGNLSNLEIFKLGNNHLGGDLPPELGGLSSLKTLELMENQFSGPLPSELTALGSLGYFDFSNTDLCEPTDVAFQAWRTGRSVMSTETPCGLNLTKSAEPDQALTGQLLTYTLKLRNDTAAPYVSVVMTDTLPPSVALVEAVPAPTNQEPGVITWAVGTLAAGEVFTATIQVSLPSTPGTLENRGQVTGASADSTAAQAYFTVSVFGNEVSGAGTVAEPVVSIQRSELDANLSWSTPIPSNLSYEVWRDPANFYFQVGTDCSASPNCNVTYAGLYLDQNVFGGSEPVCSYIVKAVGETGASALSNRVGRFEFQLVPGE